MTPNPYLFIVIFAGVALAFPLLPLGLAWLWRRFFQPPKPGTQKNAIYECGIESIGEAQIQFRSQYYLYAIIFLIFDVEAIFLVPFAVAFTGLPIGAFIAILVFLLLLIEGLVWAWGKGCLNWARLNERNRRGIAERVATARHLGDVDAGTLQLGTQKFDLAPSIRTGLLCNRDDRHRGVALRHRPVRRRNFPAVAAASGFDDRRRHGDKENGAANRPALQPDAGPEICDLDGRVRDFRRPVQARLQRAQGNRSLHPGRRLHSRLSAATGSTAARLHGIAAQDR